MRSKGVVSEIRSSFFGNMFLLTVGVLLLLAGTPSSAWGQQLEYASRIAATTQPHEVRMLPPHSRLEYWLERLDQEVTLHLKNVPLKQALVQLAGLAGLQLALDEDILPDRPVTLTVQEMPLLEALYAAVRGANLQFEVSASGYLVVVPGEKLPEIPKVVKERPVHAVTGTVTDAETGTPLPGVNIVVKGTTIGTATDVDGTYSLEAPSAQDTLVFSFVGYQPKEVPIRGRSEIDVVLQPTLMALDSLVVTALGIERERKAVGYAIQEVEGAELTQATEPNVMSSLTGEVAGLTVYNSTWLYDTPSFELRGRTPLIVVNGIPYEGANFWGIAPQNIKSITVLKGTAASALFGSRGKDGAIMVTTKGGMGAPEGVTVSYNNSTMFQAGFTAIPETQDEYGTGYAGQYKFVDGKGNGIWDGAGWIWGPKLDQRDPSTESGWMEICQWNSPINPETGECEPLPWRSSGSNNLENFLRTGAIIDQNLSVTYNHENGGFRSSLSHMYQRGQVPGTRLRRTVFSLAGTQKFGERLSVQSSYTYSKQYSPNYPFYSYSPLNAIYNVLLWLGPDVDVRAFQEYWQEGKEGIQQRYYNYLWYNNPYFLAKENVKGYHRDLNIGRLSLTYDLTENLRLRGRIGTNWNTTRSDTEVPKSLIGYGAQGDGNYVVSSATNFDVSADVLLQYERQIGEDWSLEAALGGSNRYERYQSLSANTRGLNVPGLYTLSNSVTDVEASSYLRKERISSIYSTLDIGFKDAIFLGLTGRNDWSSALPVQNNSYFYPSVALSAVVSDLVTLPDPISYFKLRTSWARVSSDLAVYSITPTYSYGVNWNGTPGVNYPGVLLNQNIQPQQSTTWEFGADLRFLDDRLRLDVTYYDRLDENDIVEFPISLASGFYSRLINANKYRSRGWEVMLEATPIYTEAFSWNLALNWSRHRRYLEQLPPGTDNLGGIQVGERMDQIIGPVFARSPKGGIIYENGFPLIAPQEALLGYSSPAWVAGFESTLHYKNWSLSFQFDGRYGGLIWSNTIRKMWWGGTHPATVNQWREDYVNGKATYVGNGVVVTGGEVVRDEKGKIVKDTRTFAPNEAEVFYVDWIWAYHYGDSWETGYFDETFFKLREATLTFQIPEAWVHRFSAKQASISFIGRNLWLWTRVPFIDPDSGGDSGSQMPSPRSIGFSVHLTF